MDLKDNTIYLVANKFHVSGDKKPCLVSLNSTIRINEPGEYKVAIWAPKEGKKNYYMMLTKENPVAEEGNQNAAPEQIPAVQKTEPPKVVPPSSLFK